MKKTNLLFSVLILLVFFGCEPVKIERPECFINSSFSKTKKSTYQVNWEILATEHQGYNVYSSSDGKLTKYETDAHTSSLEIHSDKEITSIIVQPIEVCGVHSPAVEVDMDIIVFDPNNPLPIIPASYCILDSNLLSNLTSQLNLIESNLTCIPPDSLVQLSYYNATGISTSTLYTSMTETSLGIMEVGNINTAINASTIQNAFNTIPALRNNQNLMYYVVLQRSCCP